MTQQIIALGGGGFSTHTQPGLDEYILNQSNANRPAIGFIGSASGDSEGYLVKFYSRFSKLDCTPSHLELFRRTPDIGDWMRRQDVIFVGGGNTRSMLALWRDWGLPDYLASALEEGTILSGISAGAICWFEQGITDSYSGSLRPIAGLGLLRGSCCPHYDGEAERRPTYHQMIEAGEIKAGIAIDDGVGVHFVDGAPVRVISGAPDGDAYFVSYTDGKLAETPVPDVERLDVSL